MVISLVVGVWVIRYLGPDQYGQLNYVMAYVGIAVVLVALGMDSFLIRELVNTPERKSEIIHTAFVLRIIIAGISFLGLISILYFSGESKQVFLLFFLVVPQLFSSAFSVVDLAYQADLKSRITIIARNSFFVFGAVLKTIAIITHQNLYVFATLMVLDIVLADIFLFCYYRSRYAKTQLNGITKAYTRELLFKALPFALSSVAIIVYMKVDQILLKKLASTKEVGYFTAATKVAEVFYFIPLVVTGSLFGMLVSAKKTSLKKYLLAQRKIFFFLVVLSILISVIVFIFSSIIIQLLFGTEFLASMDVLQLYIWSVIFIFAGVAFNQLLVIEEMQHIILYKTLIGVGLNILLNIILIPDYGAVGAAVATVITQFISSIAINFLFRKSRLLFLNYFFNPETYRVEEESVLR